MLRSDLYHGKIYAGDTRLASDIRIEQTEPMQLTVRAGTFRHTDGRTWVLPEDAVFDFAADANAPTECKIEIGDVAGVAGVWCGTRLLDDIANFDPPAGWQAAQLLAFPFVIPPGCTDLDAVDIFVLTVLPGFPQGTTAVDWKMQGGRV